MEGMKYDTEERRRRRRRRNLVYWNPHGRSSMISCRKYFEERNPTENVDSSQMHLAMIINSSILRATGFTLREGFPAGILSCKAVARRRCTRGMEIRQHEGMGP